MSNYKQYRQTAVDFYKKNPSFNSARIARDLISNGGAPNDDVFYRLVRKWIASERAKDYRMNDHEALEKECEAIGIPVEDVKNYWHKGEHFSINVRNDQTHYAGCSKWYHS
jgi:hypothetical protein